MRSTVWIGTSGFSYPHWQGIFYEPSLSKNEWMGFYARHFNTVEINSSFYHLPKPTSMKTWKRMVPEGFRFVFKGFRGITHWKKLQNVEEDLSNFLSQLHALKGQVIAILWQLPPKLSCQESLLEQFLKILPPSPLSVVEFRHQSWFNQSVYQMLENYHVSMCIHDFPGLSSPRIAVGPAIYIRFHGTSGRYRGSYSEKELVGWVKWIQSQNRESVFCFFNNDVNGDAIRDAQQLQRLFCSMG